MQTVKQRIANLSVIVSVTGTLSGQKTRRQDGSRSQDDGTTTRSGRFKSVASKKTNWGMAKEKETQINTEIKRENKIIQNRKQEIKKRLKERDVRH